FFWLVLLLITTGHLGGFLGLHHLLLDPEYLGKSSFWSFFIMGIALGGFTMAFHITTYIIDIQRFPFVGVLSRPFNTFCLNNSIIPIAYLLIYIVAIARFQRIDQQHPLMTVVVKVLGLLIGFIVVLILIFFYIFLTNKNVIEYHSRRSLAQLRRGLFYRAKLLRRYLLAHKHPFRVYNYLAMPWRVGYTEGLARHYNAAIALQIFRQTQRNLLLFELIAIALLFTLGFWGQYAFSQIPAAASGILFLTILVMFTGWLSFWTRGWSTTALIVLLLVLNMLSEQGWIFSARESSAFGVNYEVEPADYSLERTRLLNSKANYLQDRQYTLQILDNWRRKFPADKPPKLVIVCASGGGQRAALWALRVLQTADSFTAGRLMKHTMLMSCVSGGAFGVSYFRELYLRQKLGEPIDPYEEAHLHNISKNGHNPVVFNLVTNDMLFNLGTFRYQGMRYRRDRGAVLEEQVNKHTNYVLDKPLKAYQAPEFASTIPMLLLTPTIINDGRKLFISPHNVSYMGADFTAGKFAKTDSKIKGIDFMRCFQGQGAENLRFLSALRMVATYPYMLPSVTLPSKPKMEIMDAALFDNFGIADAVRFLHIFRDWISAHTSGVGLVIIRSTAKEREMPQRKAKSLLQQFLDPFSNFQKAWANMQDIRNNDLVEFADTWFKDHILEIEFQYTRSQQYQSQLPQFRGAALSWHMTTEEKRDILQAVHAKSNQQSMEKLKAFLE
ncbi:MAG: patatin-like phospholipase family protein, partial [Bacteroidota bacterium]